MRILIIYRPASEHARRAETYAEEFNRYHPGYSIEQLNIDTVEGQHIAQLYGVMDHPAVLALKDDGQLQQIWTGVDGLPLMNDLAYYAQQ